MGKRYYVYAAIGGFQSAHSTASAAITAAKRTVPARAGIVVTVVKSDLNGRDGQEIWASNEQVAAG